MFHGKGQMSSFFSPNKSKYPQISGHSLEICFSYWFNNFFSHFHLQFSMSEIPINIMTYIYITLNSSLVKLTRQVPEILFFFFFYNLRVAPNKTLTDYKQKQINLKITVCFGKLRFKIKQTEIQTHPQIQLQLYFYC